MRRRKWLAAVCAVLVCALGLAFAGCGKGETFQLKVIGGSGGGTYAKDAQVTVKADAPEEDFVFAGWRVEGAEEFASTDAEYTFRMVRNLTIEAVYTTTYSVWDGVYPTEAPEGYEKIPPDPEAGKPGEVHLRSASALAYWSSLLFSNTGASGGQSVEFWGYTVSLEVDVDMNGHTWNPIDAEKSVLKDVILDGKGHTIKNMVTFGQPAEQSDTHYRGIASGGFISMLGGEQHFTMKNLTFKTCSVLGKSDSGGQVGMAVGFVYNSRLTLENVRVIRSEIMQTGVSTGRIGGLVGRVGLNEDGGNPGQVEISDCEVSGCTFAGNTEMGSILGALFSYGTRTPAQFTLENTRAYDNTFLSYSDSDTAKIGFLYTEKVHKPSGTKYVFDRYLMHRQESEDDYNTCTSIYLDLPANATVVMTENGFAAILRSAVTYADTPVYVLRDIDMTRIIEENEQNVADADLSVLSGIYEVNGAKLAGLPASVLNGLTVEQI